ncbi:MAG: (Na+)-NQR maturation NqrM [Azoarcus sp.]|nr:(Na+)-NQR maturation NqrM [Azoarcus sp.]
MAIGVLFGRRPIVGSCGGLSAIGVECHCEKPCPRRLARMRAAEGETEPEDADPLDRQ